MNRWGGRGVNRNSQLSFETSRKTYCTLRGFGIPKHSRREVSRSLAFAFLHFQATDREQELSCVQGLEPNNMQWSHPIGRTEDSFPQETTRAIGFKSVQENDWIWIIYLWFYPQASESLTRLLDEFLGFVILEQKSLQLEIKKLQALVKEKREELPSEE